MNAEVGKNNAANFCWRKNISMYSNPDLVNRSVTKHRQTEEILKVRRMKRFC